MRSQGKAALGDEHDPAIESLGRAVNKTTAIADLKISGKRRSYSPQPLLQADPRGRDRRALIKDRGLSNAYITDPREPKEPILVTPS
jgi:hypothetical protein